MLFGGCIILANRGSWPLLCIYAASENNSMHGRNDVRIIYCNFVCALQKQNADDEYSNDEYVFSGQIA